jgi:hypothetical protein
MLVVRIWRPRVKETKRRTLRTKRAREKLREKQTVITTWRWTTLRPSRTVPRMVSLTVLIRRM